jgi:N-methylhydantoinase B
MVEVIRRLPAGRVEVTNMHDPFPGVPDGIPVNISVEVNPDDALVEVDLRDNVDCQPCGLNLSEACAITAATTGIFNSLDHTIPANAGSFRRIRIHLRENCVVGIPAHPTSCSAATTNLSDRVANGVQRAMTEIGDGIGLAEIGASNPPSAAVISGKDPRTDGAPFVNQLILALASGAGGPFVDGWLGGGSIGNGGQVLQDSVEVDEIKHPIRIVAQHVLPDTEGAGRNRGGPSNYVEYGPVGCDLEVIYASDGTVHPPKGARGGHPGARARQYVRSVDGTLGEALAPYGRITVKDGESIISMSCGGGGFGVPIEREPDRVRHDVLEGWVTEGRARSVYGVVFDEVRQIDEAATAAARAQLAAELETRTGSSPVATSPAPGGP